MTLRASTIAPPSELSAAAAEINLGVKDDQAYLRSTVATGRASGRDAWRWYNDIGEVHYAISRTARVAGYARFMPVVFKPNSFEVESVIDSGPAADIVASFYSPYGGVRGLIERYYTLQKVPGDSYLIRLNRGENWDGYHFASPDELDATGGFARWGRSGSVRLMTVPGGTGADGEKLSPFSVELGPQNMIGRVWSPSKRFADIPESALHALQVECEALDMLTRSIKAQLLSRFALAGILFLPPGVTMARVTKNAQRVGGQPTEEVMKLIIAAMTKNVKNHEDATAALPIILRGASADDGEKIKHIIMDRSIAETDLKLRAELIERIEQGLDSNKDQTQGVDNSTRYKNWASADDERRIAVGPDLETLCWAATRLIMRPQLKRSTPNYERIGFWYDISAASVRANQQEDARQAFDRGIISDKGTRRLSGISEDEAPDGPEQVRHAGRLSKNPYLMLYGTPEFESIDWELVKSTGVVSGPAPDSPADEPEAGPGEGDPGSPDDRNDDVPRTERPV